ncbi:glycosyltransferase [bacterium]|nr:glycosyltransferase [bacterium]
MRILTVTFYRYYNGVRGIEPQFYYLYRVPEQMGFQVDFFDYQTSLAIGIDQMRRQFLNLLRGGRYDAVFIATHQDEFDSATLTEARRHSVVFGWNSDDEWRWDDYSSRYVNDYSFMVTNSPAIMERHRAAHPNLLHAQWACTGFWDGTTTKKELDFTFVGQVYGARAGQIHELSAKAALQAFGRGTRRFAPEKPGSPWKARLAARLRRILGRLDPESVDDTISFEEVNSLWNRSRISFTPLDSSRGGVRQIKSRVFDMGLSGTLMLAHRSPHLDSYYEPDKEYVPFESMEECLDKARFYLRNEGARRQISTAYAKRTRSEHLWEHRIRRVLTEAGLLRSNI